MWQIGGELSARYPLGIGFDNSPFLREFTSEVPANLEHFHNTFLNVLVETGWLGFAIFLYWIFLFLRAGFTCRSKSEVGDIVARSIAVGGVALFIAGIVEYNFGDSEITILLFLLLGVLLGLLRQLEPAASPGDAVSPAQHQTA